METFTQLLTQGTDLTLAIFFGLCVLSFVGSLIAASLGLGGGLLVLATMFIGGSGPLVAPFVNAACGERQQVVATHAALMTFQHLFKVIAFGVLGFAFGPYIPLLIGLLLFGMLGTLTGRQILNKLPERVFRVGLQTILTLLALKLLYEAIIFHF